MENWMEAQNVLPYLGMEGDLATLEDLVEKHDIEADFDDEGNLLLVDAAAVKELLFDGFAAKHPKKLRPDHPEARRQAEINAKRRETLAQKKRAERREKFKARRSSEGRRR